MATAENVDCGSLQTEDDYSIISRPQQENIYPNFLTFDQDSVGHDVPSDASSSPLRDGCATESEHLSISHHALETAYEHMKRRIAELELINKHLKRRLKSSSSSESLNGMDQRASFQLMSSTHENEVTKAWEAYSDKCRECEKLRDELRTSEQRFLKTQNVIRDQAHKEDIMRAQVQLDHFKKKLQQAELEIRDHKSKEEMAKEELLKEKEYHETVLQAAKERHGEMESTIESHSLALQDKARQYQELVKAIESQRQMTLAVTERREALLKEQVRELEGKVIEEREERALLATQLAELEQWKQDMERFHQSSGVPFNVPIIKIKEEDVDTASNSSDIDVGELVIELRSLTDEINSLKLQASTQSAALIKLYQDPNVRQSIQSMNLNDVSVSGSRLSRVPMQCSEREPASSFTASSFPSVDQRSLLESTPHSSDEYPSSQTREILTDISRLVATREAQLASGGAHNSFGLTAPPSNEVFSSTENSSAGFFSSQSTNSGADLLQPAIHAGTEDTVTTYFSAVGELDEQSGRQNLPSRQSTLRIARNDDGSDSDTSSNNNTLIYPVPGSPNATNAESQQLLRDFINDGEPPPHYSATNQAPQTSLNEAQDVRFYGLATRSAPLLPLHPPGSSGAVLSDRMYPVLHQSRPQDDENVVATHSAVGSAAAHISLPSNHQAFNSAPLGNHNQSNQLSWSHGNEVDRSLPQVTQGHDRAFVNRINLGHVMCPVCDFCFSSGTTESFMQRHINGHFSEQEDDETTA